MTLYKDMYDVENEEMQGERVVVEKPVADVVTGAT
jgi:hypothetical protein